MDNSTSNSTNEERLASWRAVIEQCQQHPESMIIKQWLQGHGIKKANTYIISAGFER